MRAMARNAVALVGLAVAVGCGGASTAPPVEPAPDEEPVVAAEPADGDYTPPERIDEIQAALDRKRSSTARCVVEAGGESPKRAKGHVTVSFVIDRQGKARQLEVVDSSFKDPKIEQCVMDKVSQIEFGALRNELKWSYSYGFEAN